VAVVPITNECDANHTSLKQGNRGVNRTKVARISRQPPEKLVAQKSEQTFALASDHRISGTQAVPRRLNLAGEKNLLHELVAVRGKLDCRIRQAGVEFSEFSELTDSVRANLTLPERPGRSYVAPVRRARSLRFVQQAFA
jgi:hypothetical protein